MKLITLPRGAGKTEWIVEQLIADHNGIALVSYAHEAAFIVDRLMEKAGAQSTHRALYEKRVMPYAEMMNSVLPQGTRVYVDNVEMVLTNIFCAPVAGATCTVNFYNPEEDDAAARPYDWSTEPPGSEPDTWTTGPDPTLDRQWMQEDTLQFRDMDDSADVTADRVRWAAKEGNLRFMAKGEGNLISSMIGPDQHRPVIDLDMPHQYVPSSKPGHGHLYINNVVLNGLEHYLLISTLAQLGIIGKGSKAQLDAVGMSLTRPPHVKKRVPQTFRSADYHIAIKAQENCPSCNADKHPRHAKMAQLPTEERF